MFPAWSPTRWTCCARTGKIESSLPLPGSSASASAPCGRGKAGRRSSAEVFSNAYRSGTFGIKASGFCAPIFFSPNYRGRHQRQPVPGRRAAGREKVTHITAKPRTRTNVRGSFMPSWFYRGCGDGSVPLVVAVIPIVVVTVVPIVIVTVVPIVVVAVVPVVAGRGGRGPLPAPCRWKRRSQSRT